MSVLFSQNTLNGTQQRRIKIVSYLKWRLRFVNRLYCENINLFITSFKMIEIKLFSIYNMEFYCEFELNRASI